MPAHSRIFGCSLLAASLSISLASTFGAALAPLGEEEIVKPKPGQLAPSPAPATEPKQQLDVLSDSGQFYAGLPSRPKRRLTVTDAIRLALKNNTDIEVEALNPAIQNDGIRQAWGAFSSGGVTSLPRNRQDPRVFEEENYRYKISLGGKSPLGTIYELKMETDSLANTLNRESPLALFTPEYTTFAGLVMTQPLLRDAGTKAGMAEIRKDGRARPAHQRPQDRRRRHPHLPGPRLRRRECAREKGGRGPRAPVAQ
jgi:hypothetical protein